MEKLLQKIVSEKRTCYFISPHLDDAAFSSGGLISYLSNKTNVVIVNVFTKAGKDKHSLSAKSYMRQCGYKNVNAFYRERILEDRKLFESLGVRVVNLDFVDALWRKSNKRSLLERVLSIFLDDFRYIYPTHRFHISKGRIKKADIENLKRLEQKLKKIVGEGSKAQVFCPIGVGDHVDHIVTREACASVFPEVIYWEDSPYNKYHEDNADFIEKENLVKRVFAKNQKSRKDMYPAYKTQFGKLFKGEVDFKLPPESYYLKKHAIS